MFDRSWYNRRRRRAGDGFCSLSEYDPLPPGARVRAPSGAQRASDQFWFSVSRAEQRHHFKEREVHPLEAMESVFDLTWHRWINGEDSRRRKRRVLQTDTASSYRTLTTAKLPRLNAVRYVPCHITNKQRSGQAHFHADLQPACSVRSTESQAFNSLSRVWHLSTGRCISCQRYCIVLQHGGSKVSGKRPIISSDCRAGAGACDVGRRSWNVAFADILRHCRQQIFQPQRRQQAQARERLALVVTVRRIGGTPIHKP